MHQPVLVDPQSNGFKIFGLPSQLIHRFVQLFYLPRLGHRIPGTIVMTHNGNSNRAVPINRQAKIVNYRLCLNRIPRIGEYPHRACVSNRINILHFKSVSQIGIHRQLNAPVHTVDNRTKAHLSCLYSLEFYCAHVPIIPKNGISTAGVFP
jgi:hypothetical protein